MSLYVPKSRSITFEVVERAKLSSELERNGKCRTVDQHKPNIGVFWDLEL